MRSATPKALSILLALAAAIWTSPARADRIVVVGPNQGPQDVPQNQHVTAGKTVVVNNEPITIVHLEPMPLQTKFTICVKIWTGAPPPNDQICIYSPFAQDHDEDGFQISWVCQVNNSPGGDTYTVYKHVSRNGVGGDGPKINFPAGSVLLPDPPQPPGLKFMADRYPADPATETAVLAALGLPDNPGPDVWFLASGDVYFFLNGQPPGPPVHFNPSHKYGDLNCDGVVDVLDVNYFALAMLDTNAYQSANPNCDYFYADMNGDGVVNGKDVGPFIAAIMGS